MASDQPRDLAAEFRRIRPLLSDAAPCDVEIMTGLIDQQDLHIAALCRELEEHREALRWSLGNGVRIHSDKYGAIFSTTHKDDGVLIITPPEHLRPILAEAMRSK